MKRIRLASLAVAVVLVLSACNLGVPAPQGTNTISTSAAQTVAAVLSSTATSTAIEPLPTQIETQNVIETPTPTSTPACEDSASYTTWTRDNVTYDAKEVDKPLAPNAVFNMSWTIKNTGTCIWNNAYQMSYDSGTSLTQTTNFPVIPTGQVVNPGESFTVTIPMTAPAENGTYQTTFRLQNDRGKSVINLGIITKVGNPVSQSLASPGDLRYTYDCTTGSVNISLSWVDKSSNEDGFRIYRDGTKVGEVASGSTTYSDIAPGTGTFEYTVAAFNASGESPAKVSVKTSNCK